MSQIKGALIHRNWIIAARETLEDPAERCIYYDTLFDMYFNENLPLITNPVAKALFVSVRPYIIEEKQKYIDKCEKNAQNARRKATASERKRTQYNNININDNTNNNIVLTADDAKEKEKFLIYSSFFGNNSASVDDEYNKFIDYYSAVGWKTNKGAPIVSRIHAARAWNVQNTRQPNKLREMYYLAYKEVKIYNINIWRVNNIYIKNKALYIEYPRGNQYEELINSLCSAKEFDDANEHLLSAVQRYDKTIQTLQFYCSKE